MHTCMQEEAFRRENSRMNKGKRRFYSCSFTLTVEQIEWLWSHPNASKLVRELIDKAMEAEKIKGFEELKSRANR